MSPDAKMDPAIGGQRKSAHVVKLTRRLQDDDCFLIPVINTTALFHSGCLVRLILGVTGVERLLVCVKEVGLTGCILGLIAYGLLK